jgi:hypothetical protein
MTARSKAPRLLRSSRGAEFFTGLSPDSESRRYIRWNTSDTHVFRPGRSFTSFGSL